MIRPDPSATTVSITEDETVLLRNYEIGLSASGRVLRETQLTLIVYPNFKNWAGSLAEETYNFEAKDKTYFRKNRGEAGYRVDQTVNLDDLKLVLQSHGRPHALKITIHRRTSADCEPSPPVVRAVKRARDLIE